MLFSNLLLSLAIAIHPSTSLSPRQGIFLALTFFHATMNFPCPSQPSNSFAPSLHLQRLAYPPRQPMWRVCLHCLPGAPVKFKQNIFTYISILVKSKTKSLLIVLLVSFLLLLYACLLQAKFNSKHHYSKYDRKCSLSPNIKILN